MFTVIIIMFSGIIIGFLFNKNNIKVKYLENFTNIAIYILLFLLGISVGTNKTIIDNFDKIGISAFLITIATVLGSILLALFTYNLWFKNER